MGAFCVLRLLSDFFPEMLTSVFSAFSSKSAGVLESSLLGMYFSHVTELSKVGFLGELNTLI